MWSKTMRRLLRGQPDLSDVEEAINEGFALREIAPLKGICAFPGLVTHQIPGQEVGSRAGSAPRFSIHAVQM